MSQQSFQGSLTNFNAMCRSLGQMTGAGFEKAVEYEAAKVMEAAVRLTPAAKLGVVRAKHDNAGFSAQPETLYTPQSASGRKVRAAARRIGGKLLYDLTHRYPDALWAAISERRAAHLKAIIAARGLSKRTWVQLARLFGFEITAAGFVKKAVPAHAPEAAFLGNMRFRRLGSRSTFTLFIENAQPTVNKIGGEFILQRAMNRRVNFFRQNLKRLVFESAAAVAKRYPGVRTTAA